MALSSFKAERKLVSAQRRNYCRDARTRLGLEEPASGCSLADVDEVAGWRVLARPEGLEVSVDGVLHVGAEGVAQQLAEALQAVRVVGQPELTAQNQNRD